MSRDSNKRIGDYEVLELIGSGAQGRVYRARYCGQPKENLSPGDIVALKVYNPVSNEGDFERFLKNTDLFKEISHPNIVKYLDTFLWDDGWQQSPCLAMEHLDGMSLQSLLKQHPQGLPWEQARIFFRQFLEALIFARSHGVIHRDIKPANIFVFPDGRLKLIDFGVARRDEGSQSSTAGWRGSFDYMAPDFVYDPELLQNFRGDECSDIFSASAVFYEMLAGHPPFKPLGESGPAGYMSRWRKGSEPALGFSHGMFRVLSHAGSFLRKGLSPVRQERFQSFVEMLEAFSTIQSKILRYDGADAYEFIEFIGKGGFGTVYRAKDLQSGEIVAIKHLALSEQSKRFLREARLLKEYRHPNLVRYINFIHVPDRNEYYLIMECLPGVPGWSLRDRLKSSQAAVGLLESLKIFDAYLSALIYLHEKGVIHRDIKPSNLYAPPGNPSGAKIFDMGIARDLRGTQTAGHIPGTFDYMAPEFVLQVNVRGDARTDLYALGLSLYEAVSGRRAFPRLPASPRDAYLELQKRAKASLEIPLNFGTAIQYAQLRKILQVSTAKDPHRRYHSAEAMQHDIRAFIKELESAVYDDEAETKFVPETDQLTVPGTVLESQDGTTGQDQEIHPQTDATHYKETPSGLMEEKTVVRPRRPRPAWIKYSGIAAAGSVVLTLLGLYLRHFLQDPNKADKQAMQAQKDRLMTAPDGSLSFVSNLAHWIEFGKQRTNSDPVYAYWIKDLTALGETEVVTRFSNRFVKAESLTAKEDLLQQWRAVSNHAAGFSWWPGSYTSLLGQMQSTVGRESFDNLIADFIRAWPGQLSGTVVLKRADDAAGFYLKLSATTFDGVLPDEKKAQQDKMFISLQEGVSGYLNSLLPAGKASESDELLAFDQLTAFKTAAPTLENIFQKDCEKLSLTLEAARETRQFEAGLREIDQMLTRAETPENYQAVWQRLQTAAQNLRGDTVRASAVEQLRLKLDGSVRAWADSVSTKAESSYAALDLNKGNAEAARLADGRNILSEKALVSYLDGLTGKLVDQRTLAQARINKDRAAEAQKASQVSQSAGAAIQAVNAFNSQLDQISRSDTAALEACIANARTFLTTHQTALAEASVQTAWGNVEKRVSGLLSDYIQLQEPLADRPARLKNAARWLGAPAQETVFSKDSLQTLSALLAQQQKLYLVEIRNETDNDLYIESPDGKATVATGKSLIQQYKVDDVPVAFAVALSGPEGFRPEPSELSLHPESGGSRTVSITDMQALPVKVLRKEIAVAAGAPSVQAEWFDESSKDWKPVINEGLVRPGERSFRFIREDYEPVERTASVPRGVQYFTLEDPDLAGWKPSAALGKLYDAEARLNRNDWDGAQKVFETLKPEELRWPAHQNRRAAVASALSKHADEVKKALEELDTIRQLSQEGRTQAEALQKLDVFSRSYTGLSDSKVDSALAGLGIVRITVEKQTELTPPVSVQYRLAGKNGEWIDLPLSATLFKGAYEIRFRRPDYRDIEQQKQWTGAEPSVVLTVPMKWEPAPALSALLSIQDAWKKQDEEMLNQLLVREPVLEAPLHRQSLDKIKQDWMQKVKTRFEEDFKAAESTEVKTFKQIIDPSVPVLTYRTVAPESVRMLGIPAALQTKMTNEAARLKILLEKKANSGATDERQQAHQQYAFERNFPNMTPASLAQYVRNGGTLNEYDLRLALYAARQCGLPALKKFREQPNDASSKEHRAWSMEIAKWNQRALSAFADLKTVVGGANQSVRQEMETFLTGGGYADRKANEWLIVYLKTFEKEAFPNLGKETATSVDIQQDMDTIRLLMEGKAF